MPQHFTGKEVDSYARLAIQPPDFDLLRRYFTECQAGNEIGPSPLTTSERRWVATNLEANNRWQAAWRQLEMQAGRKVSWQATSRIRLRANRSAKRISRPRWVEASIASVILLYVLLWLGGRVFLSETFELASIEGYEMHLDRQTRSNSTISQTKFAEGAKALLDARTSTLGLFPRYVSNDAQKAVTELNDAFDLSRDPFERAEIAFFLAKAHLMIDDLQSARGWLEQVELQRVADYRIEAAELLSELDKVND